MGKGEVSPSSQSVSDWLAEVHAQGVARVASAFGYELARRGRSLSMPCPACGQVTRHRKSKDKRGAVEVVGEGLGWRCWQCDATGDAVRLAALVVTGRAVPVRERWADVRRACAERGLCDPDPRDTRPPPKVRPVSPPPLPASAPVRRPPPAELAALWAAGIRPALATVSECAATREAAAYVASRHVNLGDLDLFEPELCRILPAPGAYAFPAWWPSRWAALWRWAVLAYEPDGTVGSIHARAVGASGEAPKTRWPKGCDAGGLLFADSRGVALLRGQVADVDSVTVTEGLTDFVAASLWAHRTGLNRRAVLGIASGGARAFERVRWPEGMTFYVATDPDKQGERYAAKVRAGLPAQAKVRRWRFSEGGAQT